MKIDRARRLLRHSEAFAVVPQRFIPVIDHLLSYIQPSRPAAALALSADQIATALGRTRSFIVDTLSWMEDAELGSVRCDGELVLVELRSEFLEPLGLLGQPNDLMNNNSLCSQVIHRKCG